MKSAHRPFALALVMIALPIVLAACGSGGGDPNDAMKTAGGLSESRLPQGLKGDSPAPTGFLPRDKSLEAGWYKRAKEGKKAPTYNDRGSAPIGG